MMKNNYFFYKKVHIKRHTGKVGPMGKVGPGTHAWELGPGNLYLGPEAQDPGPLSGTQDLGSSTWDPVPRTWDPICGNLDPMPLLGTRDPYLGTLTLIQLSLDVQFSSSV